MTRNLLAALITLSPSLAIAQPKEVWDFHAKMGGGSLILHFCGAPKTPWYNPFAIPVTECEDRQAIVFGQVCDSNLAKTMASGESGDVKGGIPKDMKYAGFYCQNGGKLHTPEEHIFGGGNWMN